MLFSWLDARDAKQFGISLADFFSRRVPAEVANSALQAGTLKFKEKEAEVIGKLFSQTERFRCDHKLNLYKKAKLANAFKWQLLDQGYESGFVDELTKEVLLRL